MSWPTGKAISLNQILVNHQKTAQNVLYLMPLVQSGRKKKQIYNGFICNTDEKKPNGKDIAEEIFRKAEAKIAAAKVK